MAQKKYNIIYLDPPWMYKTWSERGNDRNADQHYPVMHISDIEKLDVSGAAARDCALIMWATFPCLQDAINLGKKWGFTYKTVLFVWIKENKIKPGIFQGMGYYTRSNAEICILFTKGKPLKRVSRKVSQVIISKREEHSKKPAEARERIVELFGDLPRLEMFARERDGLFGMAEYKGWDVWGNQVKSEVEIKSIKDEI